METKITFKPFSEIEWDKINLDDPDYYRWRIVPVVKPPKGAHNPITWPEYALVQYRCCEEVWFRLPAALNRLVHESSQDAVNRFLQGLRRETEFLRHFLG